jgi:hypothetical protein
VDSLHILVASNEGGIPILTGWIGAWVGCVVVIVIGLILSASRGNKRLGQGFLVCGCGLAVLLLLVLLVWRER